MICYFPSRVGYPVVKRNGCKCGCSCFDSLYYCICASIISIMASVLVDEPMHAKKSPTLPMHETAS